MWGAYRWAARLLLLVMLVPALGPMAMPCTALPQVMHCMRRSPSGQAVPGEAASERSAQPAMPCHHAMAQPPRGESSEASYHATDNCCQNHCCCGATTSEWARPASSLLSSVSLTVEPARPMQDAAILFRDGSRQDSARAPPRS